jgi:hypothetical protein
VRRKGCSRRGSDPVLTCMKAWLITWDWAANTAIVADHVAAILSPRWGADRITCIVEFLYAKRTASASEMAAYAGRPTRNPYRIEADFNGNIICGHDPWLHARRVTDLKVSIDPDTRIETISWTEPPLTRPQQRGFPKTVRKSFASQYRRQITGPLSDEIIWDPENGHFKSGWNPPQPIGNFNLPVNKPQELERKGLLPRGK